MTAFLFWVTLASSRLPFLLLERPRRESHCQHGEHASTLQSTSPASYSRDITMSATVGATDHLSIDSYSSPPRSFYTFLHKGTIKRFPSIGFPFAGHIITPAFIGYFLGTLLLMLPDGFGNPIAGFANPHNERWRDTPHLTHTPSSFGGSSSRGAFTFASHDDSCLRAEHRVPFIHVTSSCTQLFSHTPSFWPKSRRSPCCHSRDTGVYNWPPVVCPP